MVGKHKRKPIFFPTEDDMPIDAWRPTGGIKKEYDKRKDKLSTKICLWIFGAVVVAFVNWGFKEFIIECEWTNCVWGGVGIGGTTVGFFFLLFNSIFGK